MLGVIGFFKLKNDLLSIYRHGISLRYTLVVQRVKGNGFLDALPGWDRAQQQIIDAPQSPGHISIGDLLCQLQLIVLPVTCENIGVNQSILCFSFPDQLCFFPWHTGTGPRVCCG